MCVAAYTEFERSCVCVAAYTEFERSCVSVYLVNNSPMMLDCFDDGFLSVDEVDGAVYQIPVASLAVALSSGMRMNADKWESSFVQTRRDATCFLNAETISWTCGHQAPSLVFKSATSGYIYTQTVEVSQPSPGTSMGKRFIWPISYHAHDIVWSKVLDRTLPVLVDYPRMQKSDPGFKAIRSDAPEQRPRPRHILGAIRLDNPGISMSISDRTFFLDAITGRFVFRDATECIDSFVRHTRKRKENFPERMRFNSQLNRCKQLQRDAHCDEMKRRARADPQVYRDIKLRAVHGMRFLASLTAATKGAGTAGAAAVEPGHSSPSILDTLGPDMLESILENVVISILKTPDAKMAAARFSALVEVDKAFRAIATSISNRLLCSAHDSLREFIQTGRLSTDVAVERLPWLTYSRFSCSPSLILRLVDRKLAYREYLLLRLECNLESNVCVARAHARGAPSPLSFDDDDGDDCESENVVAFKMKPSQSFEFCNLHSTGSLPLRIAQLYNIASGET